MGGVTEEPNLNFTDDYSGYSASYQDVFFPQTLPFSSVYVPILYFLIFFAGVSGNLFVIVVTGTKKKRNLRLVDSFVVNLAAADLMFVFTLPLWAVSASRHNQWDFGVTLCKLSSYVIAVTRFSNIFFLTCMSVDRYLAVVKHLDSRFIRTSGCVQLTCVVVWTLSLTLGIPSFVSRELTFQNDAHRCRDNIRSSLVQATGLLTVVLTFLLPVLIIFVCYGSIVVSLHQHCAVARNPRANARSRHTIKIVFTIMTAFVVSWLPFNVLKSMQVVSEMRGEELSMETHLNLYKGLTLSCCLAFVNSCVNPAIYLFLDQNFRHRVGNLCLACLGDGEARQGPHSSSYSVSPGHGENWTAATASRSHLLSHNTVSKNP